MATGSLDRVFRDEQRDPLAVVDVRDAGALIPEWDEGGSLTGVRALLLARNGETREARTMIARAIELGTGFGHFHHTAYNVAATYVALQEPDEAIDWIEAAADDGFPCYPYFERDPKLDGLRGYPRFVDLMSQLYRQWEHFKQMA